MAGSWKHTVTKRGKLRKRAQLLSMLETRSGDVYEYAEEAYGMVWWLATKLAATAADRYGQGLTPAEWVEQARVNYEQGLKASPGEQEK